jgi:hypothetical protein
MTQPLNQNRGKTDTKAKTATTVRSDAIKGATDRNLKNERNQNINNPSLHSKSSNQGNNNPNKSR